MQNVENKFRHQESMNNGIKSQSKASQQREQ